MNKKDMLAQAVAGFSSQPQSSEEKTETNTPTPNIGEAENTVSTLQDDKPNAERSNREGPCCCERRTVWSSQAKCHC